MPTYILRSRYTQQGLEQVKDGPARVEAARKTLESLGGQLRSFHLTMGQYDAVAVIEAPDDEAVARFSIAIGSQGNVRIESMRAFDEDQFHSLVRNLP